MNSSWPRLYTRRFLPNNNNKQLSYFFFSEREKAQDNLDECFDKVKEAARTIAIDHRSRFFLEIMLGKERLVFRMNVAQP